MSSPWVIWYSSQVKTPMSCGSYIWKFWITQWAKNKIAKDRLSDEIVIPCPYYECKHNLSNADLINTIGPRNFEILNEEYIQIYLSNTDDIRRCPNDNCDYAGVISLKPWSDNLSCPECGYDWRELAQMSTSQKVIRNIQNTLSLKSETFSYVNEVLTGVPCPNWGLVITKNGGWNHMIWGKCAYEFWWWWLGHFPSYSHTETTFCPIRFLFPKIMIFILLIGIYAKLWRDCSYFYVVHSFIYMHAYH